MRVQNAASVFVFAASILVQISASYHGAAGNLTIVAVMLSCACASLLITFVLIFWKRCLLLGFVLVAASGALENTEMTRGWPSSKDWLHSLQREAEGQLDQLWS